MRGQIRPGKSVMVAQGLALVGCSEAAASLQYGDDLIGEHIEHEREERWHQIETVSRATIDPVFHDISDLLRSAGHHEMPARAGQFAQSTQAIRGCGAANEVAAQLGANVVDNDQVRLGRERGFYRAFLREVIE